ncbi:MAG TPA: hypothetical protein VKT51_10995 [Candidatus Eremiobacteraceae bacterium]|nr:hypothetical protein [Candidatus Eremiobacteraceae bacterium]
MEIRPRDVNLRERCGFSEAIHVTEELLASFLRFVFPVRDEHNSRDIEAFALDFVAAERTAIPNTSL